MVVIPLGIVTAALPVTARVQYELPSAIVTVPLLIVVVSQVAVLVGVAVGVVVGVMVGVCVSVGVLVGVTVEVTV